MYDLRYLRDNLDAIREQLGPRGADVPWERLRTLIEQRRAAAVPTVAKAIGSTDLAVTKRVLDAFLPALSENGCFTQKAVAGSLDTMLEAKIIETKADPAEGVLWTGKYNSC